MLSLAGMPSPAAIPVLREPGSLAASAKTAAAVPLQPGKAAVSLNLSFRDRLRAMFATDSEGANQADSESAEPAGGDGIAAKFLATRAQPISAKPVLMVRTSTGDLRQPSALCRHSPPQLPQEETPARDPSPAAGSTRPYTMARKPDAKFTPSSPSRVSPHEWLADAASQQPIPTPCQAPIPQPSKPATQPADPAPESSVPANGPGELRRRPLTALKAIDEATLYPVSRDGAVIRVPAQGGSVHSAVVQVTASAPADASASGNWLPTGNPAQPANGADGHEKLDAPTAVSTPPVETAPRVPVKALAEPAAPSQGGQVPPSLRPAGSVQHMAESKSPQGAPAATEAWPAHDPTPAREFTRPQTSTSAPLLPVPHAPSPPASGILPSPLAHGGTAFRDSFPAAGSVDTAPADAFEALNSASPAPQATWIHLGPTRAEAGYLDPSLGWVGVRAETAGAGLHASIVPSSPEAAQILGAELAGLNTYLAGHRGEGAQLTIASPESGQSFAHHSGSESFGQPAGDQPQRDPPSSVTPVSLAPVPKAAGASPAPLASGFETPAFPAWSGGHVSVIV